MTHKLKFVYVAVLTLACACGRPEAASDPSPADVPEEEPAQNESIGRFRGYVETNRLVNERLFARPEALSLSAYFEAPITSANFLDLLKPKLRDLLGAYAGDGLRTDIKNALPNSVNMLLWYMAIDGLADELSAGCADAPVAPTAFALADVKPGFADAFAKVCAGLTAGAVADDALKALYGAVLDADAPEGERDAWLAFAKLTPGATPRAVLRDQLLAMMYSPYFLLKQ